MTDRPPCRCLLMAAGQEELHRVVAEYIATLPEEARVPDEAYRARLEACQQCGSLNDGTCAQCGCYVEARAAKRGLGCPAVPPRWRPMPIERPDEL